jgi:hypothetical protein
MALKQLVTLAVILVAQAGTAHSASSLRGELEQRYAVMMTAIESKDEAAIRSILADGFVNVDVDGNALNEAQMIKRLPAIPNDPNRQLQITILSVHGDKRAAIVKQRSVTTTKVNDSDGSQKAAKVSAVSKDNWVNENGSWRLLRTVMLAVDGTVDGKAVVHKRNPTPR